MTTIEKLAAYRRALERYKRRVFDAEEANGKTHRKPFAEVYPMRSQFEMKEDDAYALKIHADVMKNKVGVPKRI
jgi:hypothetical protein